MREGHAARRGGQVRAPHISYHTRLSRKPQSQSIGYQDPRRTGADADLHGFIHTEWITTRQRCALPVCEGEPPSGLSI